MADDKCDALYGKQRPTFRLRKRVRADPEEPSDISIIYTCTLFFCLWCPGDVEGKHLLQLRSLNTKNILSFVYDEGTLWKCVRLNG